MFFDDVPSLNRKIEDTNIKDLSVFSGEIMSKGELPENFTLLSGVGSRIRLSRDDRMCSAVLQGSDNSIYLLILNNSTVTRNYKRVKRLIEDCGYILDRLYFVNNVVLDSLYNGVIEDNPVKFKSSSLEKFNNLINSAIDKQCDNVNIIYNAKAYLSVSFSIFGQNIHQYNVDKETGKKMITAYYRDFDTENKSTTEFDLNIKTDASYVYIYKDFQYTLRWHGSPTHSGGYHITIRINKTSGDILAFSQLGYDSKTIEFLDYLSAKDSGLFLWVGQTNSGKTTSNASFLNNMLEVSNWRRKAVSVEDPVEIQIPTVVHHSLFTNKNDLSPWQTAIKDFKRMASDIVFIGELRDSIVAEACIDQVLSGQFTISTFHSTSWIEAMIRIIKVLGLNPYTLCLKSVLKGVLAQMLAPVTCDKCCLKYDDVKDTLSMRKQSKIFDLFENDLSGIRFRNYNGECSSCGESNGIKGRTPIYEIYKPTDEINSLLINSQFVEARSKWADTKDGINGVSMMDRALIKAKEGVIDPVWIIDKLVDDL